MVVVELTVVVDVVAEGCLRARPTNPSAARFESNSLRSLTLWRKSSFRRALVSDVRSTTVGSQINTPPGRPWYTTTFPWSKATK